MIDATPETAPARPARAPRRSPNELTFTLEEAFVEAAAAGEPEWLAADRRAAFERYQALPIETNQLYTTYVDLRTADLSAVRPWDEPPGAPDLASGALPEGAAGFAGFHDDGGIEALVLDDATRDAGVILDSLGALVRR
ncbi:MAG TPA: hypothetical protein VGJ71_00050, partial [Candidatus Limnocylindrales bacterium]